MLALDINIECWHLTSSSNTRTWHQQWIPVLDTAKQKIWRPNRHERHKFVGRCKFYHALWTRRVRDKIFLSFHDDQPLSRWVFKEKEYSLLLNLRCICSEMSAGGGRGVSLISFIHLVHGPRWWEVAIVDDDSGLWLELFDKCFLNISSCAPFVCLTVHDDQRPASTAQIRPVVFE